MAKIRYQCVGVLKHISRQFGVPSSAINELSSQFYSPNQPNTIVSKSYQSSHGIYSYKTKSQTNITMTEEPKNIHPSNQMILCEYKINTDLMDTSKNSQTRQTLLIHTLLSA